MFALFYIVIVAAALFTSLTAGLLLGFALLVMPGIGKLEDGEFIRAFQKIDGIIQAGNPLFLLLWLGSALLTVAAIPLGWSVMGVGAKIVLGLAAAVYVLLVQVPTATINVPLNNHLQTVDTEEIDAGETHAARAAFEGRWNRWNRIRTVVAAGVSLLLILIIGSL